MLCPEVEGLSALASNLGSLGNGPGQEAAVSRVAWGWPSLDLQPKSCWLETGGLGFGQAVGIFSSTFHGPFASSAVLG